ncbi:MAG: NAD(P)H-dependent oxidoreductase [bacterium]
MTPLIEAMNWRYATKIFDSTKKLTDEQLNNLIDAVSLSASSYGLQPWKIIVVKNPELRAQIKESAWGQTQTTDSSHLIVFAIVKNVDDAYIDKFVNLVSTTRGVDTAHLEGYSQMMKGAIKTKMDKGGVEAVKEWSARQAYIALGGLLTACATLKIDSCPMEGFDNKKVDEILGLNELGLESVVMCPLGYRSETDEYATYKKVRFAKEDVVIEK